MKKIRHYYKPAVVNFNLVRISDIKDFQKISGLKIYSEKSAQRFFTYDQKASDEAINAAFFEYVGHEEVEIDEGVVKLPIDNKYRNGYNWKTTGPNTRLKKQDPNYNPYDKLNKGKPPINPKTGRRDGGV
jgi:hypothetical protein